MCQGERKRERDRERGKEKMNRKCTKPAQNQESNEVFFFTSSSLLSLCFSDSVKKTTFACLRICVFVFFFYFISILHNLYKVDETYVWFAVLNIFFFVMQICEHSIVLSFFFRSSFFSQFLSIFNQVMCAHSSCIRRIDLKRGEKSRKGQLNNYSSE